METISQTLDQLGAALQQNLPFVFSMLAILWGVQILNWVMHYRLNTLGVIPRNIIGLRGIVFSPFLHGSFTHLLFNSIPFAVLSALILMEGQQRFIQVSLWIIGVSGGATWLFGRYAIHVGASSLVLGYMGYLFANAYYHPSFMTVLLVGLMLYYFAGLLLNLFPIEKTSSWEGHVFGFLSGIFTAWYLA